MNDRDYREDSIKLNSVYWQLAVALGYPGVETGEIDVDENELMEDALHMIELGHRYLDAEDRGLVSRWSD